MDQQRTSRLVDATDRLDPADRALLDLWLNRGLEDGRIAQLTGTSLDALGSRRARLTAQLSQDLGFAPDDVQEALADLARDARDSRSSSAPGAADAEPDRRRRRLRVAIGGGLIILAALVVGVILLTTGGGHHQASTHARSLAAPAGSAPRPASAQGQTASTRPLASLPGGPPHASGSARLIGSGASAKLELTVASLPTPRSGHYEVWLYNSVLDSRALGALHPGTSTYALPPGAGRYRWIDVSLQPAGSVNHSGESELRAANPVG